MAQTDTRPGFRLPWSSDRPDVSDPTGSAPDASAAGDAPATDAPATEESEGPEMIDTSPAVQDADSTEAVADSAEAAAPELESEPEAAITPVVETVAAEPEVAAAPAPAHVKSVKSSKFLADLTKAMQATAEAARNETLERFAADAKTATEKVQASAADEITELRRSADEDVAAIREWSKGEIARIREETETRISARKSYLEGELESHGGVIERRVERINASVADFEAEMAAFCERLFAEGDPATFAAMAEQLPEPPSLEEPFVEPAALIGAPALAIVIAPEAEPETTEPVEAAVPEAEATSPTDETSAEAVVETDAAESDAPEATAETVDAPEATAEVTAEVPAEPEAETGSEPEPTIDAEDPRIAMLSLSPDFAAAEAEAEMSAAESAAGEEAAADAGQEIPTIAEEVVAARLAGLVPPSDAGDPSERLTTKVVVSGLVSVASIAAFKRGVARTQGVASVGVTSGPDGEFVFMVSHNPSIDLKEIIPGLPGFGARVTGDSDDGFVVSARDPEARD
jgi:hypothetical protein